MDLLLQIMPIILYTLGAILLIVLIVLGIKLIETVDRTNVILDDVEKKAKSLNGLFNMIDTATDTLANISDSIVSNVAGFLSKIFHRKKKEEREYE